MNLKQLRLHRKHLEEKHRQTMDMLDEQITVAVRKRKVACANCLFRGYMADWTFIQTFTEEPSPCGCDSLWKPLPPEDCLVICPQCRKQSRVGDHLYRIEFTETAEEPGLDRKRLFGKYLEKYGAAEPESPMSDSEN